MESRSKRRRAQENSGNERVTNSINALPDYLLYLIMSMLSTKEAVRMSVVSKRWEMIWATFPVMNLDEKNFIDRKQFVQCLQFYSSRHHMANLEKLKLRVISSINGEVYQLIDRFMFSAVNGNVKHLNLKLYNGRHPKELEFVCDRFYVLPELIFSQGSSLISLNLVGCRIVSSQVFDVSLLSKLSMKNVVIEEEFLEKLMHACPVLEILSIIYCYGLRSMKIIHDRLRYFVLGASRLLEAVEIDLPKLKSFKYKGYYNVDEGYKEASEIDILNIVRAQRIYTFSLKHASLSAEAYQNMQFKHLRSILLSDIEVHDGCFWFTKSCFPFLVSLYLKRCRWLKHMGVISSKIKTLSIENCVDLKDCKVLTPNLESFNFQGPLTKFCGELAFDNVQANLTLLMFENYHSHILQLSQLRFFLQTFFSAGKITLTLVQHCGECMIRLKEANKPILNYVQHLEVQIERNSVGLIGLLCGSLAISTHCKTLCLYVDSLHMKLEFQGSNRNEETSAQDLPQTSHDIPLKYLTKLWISGFRATEEELHQVSFVIEKAKQLKYISIHMTDNPGLETEFSYLKLKSWKESLAQTSPQLEFVLIA